MKCTSLESAVVDYARGVALDGDAAAQVERHLRECEACAARLDRERSLSAELRHLADAVVVPPPASAAEAALLAAFDAARERPRAIHRSRLAYAAAAAAIAFAVTVPMLTRRPLSEPASRLPLVSRSVAASMAALPPQASSDPFDRIRRRGIAETSAPSFVAWPGAADLPAFESGRLVRVAMPTSVARSLGLIAEVDLGGVVPAEVLIGQDGFARAVRLAPVN